MNDKSLWQSIGSTAEPVPANETIVNITKILSFVKDHQADVGVSTWSMTVKMMHDEIGMPESSIYRYIQKMLQINFIKAESKRVQVFQRVEVSAGSPGVLPDRFFKDVNSSDSELLPRDVPQFVFVESGEMTLKMYRVTETGDRFLQSMISK